MIKTNPTLLARDMFVADRDSKSLGMEPKDRVYTALLNECEACEIDFDEEYADQVVAAYESELEQYAQEVNEVYE